MKTINSDLVLWFISKEGIDFTDSENIETVAEMITKILIVKQLNGYTAKSFSLVVDV
jgi:hypothetical protein